jgi:hypothetical protein
VTDQTNRSDDDPDHDLWSVQIIKKVGQPVLVGKYETLKEAIAETNRLNKELPEGEERAVFYHGCPLSPTDMEDVMSVVFGRAGINKG